MAGYARRWLAQSDALLRKNLAVLRFRLVSTTAVVVIPALFVLALYALHSGLSAPDTGSYDLVFDRCESFNAFHSVDYAPQQPCVTLAYAPAGNPGVDAIMARFAAKSPGLQLGVDVVGFPDDASIAGAMFDNPTRMIEAAVSFTNSTPFMAPLPSTALPDSPQYVLWLNGTLIQDNAAVGKDPLWRSTGVSGRYLALQRALDEAIIGAALDAAGAGGAASADLSGTAAAFSDYERPSALVFTGSPAYQALFLASGTFLSAACVLSALLILTTVAGEKARKLTASLRGMGLIESTYWLSWFGGYVPLFLCLALLAGLVGRGTGLELFTRTEFSVTFVFILLLAAAFGSCALSIASCVRAQRSVNVASFCWFALTAALTITFSFTGVYDIAYAPTIPAILPTVTGVMPFFHAGRFTNSMLRAVYMQQQGQEGQSGSGGGGGGGGGGGVSCSLSSSSPSSSHASSLVFAAEEGGWSGSVDPFTASFLTAERRAMELRAGVLETLGLDGSALLQGLHGDVYSAVMAWDQPTLLQEGRVTKACPPLAAAATASSAGTHAVGGTDGAAAPSGAAEPLLGSEWVVEPILFGWAQVNQQPAAVNIKIAGQVRAWQDRAPSFDLAMLGVLCAGYVLLAWYLGQVATADLGAARPAWFPFLPSYWGLGGKAKTVWQPGDTLAAVQAASAADGSIRVHKLSKTFKETTALKEISLTIKRGECTAVLGSNGAGKSTLLGVLTGLLAPTHGEVFVGGDSIRDDLDGFRDKLGVCPQDDLLWAELTAREHMELAARFKGVPKADIRSHVNDLLARMGLLNVAGGAVDSFSGGMKRRLSVALAACGSPTIIHLDEPTTGLDPLSRRLVWKLVEHLKPGRIVVLTTHAMDEADSLGDSVCIVSGGRLRAYGTPLFLKSRFGAGFSLSLLTTPALLPRVRELARTMLPGAEVVGEGSKAAEETPAADPSADASGEAAATGIAVPAGAPGTVAAAAAPASGAAAPPPGTHAALTVSVPRPLVRSIPAFLRAITSTAAPPAAGAEGAASGAGDAASASGPLVSSWGVSQSTLEEVFLRLAVASKEVNAPVGSGAGAAPGADGAAAEPAALALAPAAAPGPAPAACSPLCSLCGVAPSERVTLFTSRSLEVSVADAICAACSTRTAAEVEAAKAAVAPYAAAPSAGVAEAAHHADVPTAAGGAAAVAAPAPFLTAAAAVPLLVSAASAARDGSGGDADASLGKGVAAIRPATHGDSAAGPKELPPPVSFWSQFAAVFVLRVKLQARARRTTCCQLVSVLVGVILSMLLAGATPDVKVTQCAQGFYSPNVTTFSSGVYQSLCNRATFVDYVVGAVLRAPATGVWWGNVAYDEAGRAEAARPAAPVEAKLEGGSHRSLKKAAAAAAATAHHSAPAAQSRKYAARSLASAAHTSTTAAASAAGSDAASVSSSGSVSAPASVSGITPTFQPGAQLLYRTFCGGSNGGGYNPQSYCPWPVLRGTADWLQLYADVESWFNDPTMTQRYAPATIHYTDSPAAGDVSLSALDLLGLNASGWLPAQQPLPAFPFQLVNKGITPTGGDSAGSSSGTPPGSSNLDSMVYTAQQAASDAAVPMNGTCQFYGSRYAFDPTISGYDGYLLPSGAAAYNFYTNSFPSISLALSKATVTPSSATFAYDLRTWALQSCTSTYAPFRSTAYTWAGAFANSAYACQNAQRTDNVFDALFPSQTVTPWDPLGSSPACVQYNSHSNILADGVTGSLSAPVALNMLHSGILRASLAAAGVPGAGNATIRTAIAEIPPVVWIPATGPAVASGASTFGSLLFPLFTSILLPTLASTVSGEKESKLLSLMTMAGLRLLPYFVANVAFSVALFLPTGYLYVLAGNLAGVGSFTNASVGLFSALLLTWAFAQAGWSLLIGALFRTSRVSSIIAYLLVILVPLANFLIGSFVTPVPTALAWLPMMSYARASALVLAYGGSTVQPGSELQSALVATLFEGALAMLLAYYFYRVLPGPEGTGVSSSPLFPLHELASVARRIAACARSGAARGASSPVTAYAALPGESSGSSAAHAVAFEDPDVADERRSVCAELASSHGTAAPSSAVLVAGLVKTYDSRSLRDKLTAALLAPLQRLCPRRSSPRRHGGASASAPLLGSEGGAVASYGAVVVAAAAAEGEEEEEPSEDASVALHVKRAVDSLFLRVQTGESLGLLGPNGAGKTTTISILTGSLTGSSGLALVSGCDVATDMNRIYRSLGVCPQFDVVMDDLPVREHLYFFARVKGVPSDRIRGVVQSIAERTQLDGDPFSMPARTLSGGMRRRLSIAIALLGDPSLLIVDEPTTGLDPETKQSIHKLLQREKHAGRALILTTHGMDEADALCSRIAIMANGRLQAVGSQQLLKARYGSGYRLSVAFALKLPAGAAPSSTQRAQLQDSAEKAVDSWVRAHISAAASPPDRVGSTLSFTLPQAGLDVAAALLALERSRAIILPVRGPVVGAIASIVDYGLAQTSLEDVFVSVVERASA